MTAQKTASPWVYLLVGCLGLVLIGVVAAVAIGFMAYRWGKDFQDTMNDPVARTHKVQEILGCDELPDGYHAMVGITIPFLVEVAILSDVDPGPEMRNQGFDDRGFIYLKMLTFGKQGQELKDFFDGKTDDASVLRRNNINIDVDEILERGLIEADAHDLRYLVQRGNLGMHGSRVEGLTSMILVECPEDRKTRMAIWFESDEIHGGSDDLTGTPGDKNAIRDFMGRFRLCGEA